MGYNAGHVGAFTYRMCGKRLSMGGDGAGTRWPPHRNLPLGYSGGASRRLPARTQWHTQMVVGPLQPSQRMAAGVDSPLGVDEVARLGESRVQRMAAGVDPPLGVDEAAKLGAGRVSLSKGIGGGGLLIGERGCKD